MQDSCKLTAVSCLQSLCLLEGARVLQLREARCVQVLSLVAPSVQGVLVTAGARGCGYAFRWALLIPAAAA